MMSAPGAEPCAGWTRPGGLPSPLVSECNAARAESSTPRPRQVAPFARFGRHAFRRFARPPDACTTRWIRLAAPRVEGYSRWVSGAVCGGGERWFLAMGIRMRAFHRTTILASVVALLLGPQWCCCSMRALAGPRVEATAACCPCCRGPASETRCADLDRPAEHDGDQDGHRCPCRSKHRSVATAAVQVEQRSFAPSGPVLAGTFTEWPLPEAVASGDAGFSGRPTPTAGRSLLSLLGVLRC